VQSAFPRAGIRLAKSDPLARLVPPRLIFTRWKMLETNLVIKLSQCDGQVSASLITRTMRILLGLRIFLPGGKFLLHSDDN